MRWVKLLSIFGLLVLLLIVWTVASPKNPEQDMHRLLVAEDLSPFGDVNTMIPESPFEKGKSTGPGALAGWEEARSTSMLVSSSKPGENAAIVTNRSYKVLTPEAAQAALRAVQDPGQAFSWVTRPEDASLPDQTRRQSLAGRSSGWRAWHGTDNEGLPAYALWIQFGSYISEVQLTVGVGQESFGHQLFNHIIDRLIADPSKRQATVPAPPSPSPEATTPPLPPTVTPSPTPSPTPWVDPFGRAKDIPSPDGRWTAVLNTKVGSLDLRGPGAKSFSILPPGSTADSAIWSRDSRSLFVVRTNFLPPQASMASMGSAPIQLWQIPIQESGPSAPALIFQSPSKPQPSGTYLPEQIVLGRWSPNNRYLLFWHGFSGPSFQADGLSMWALDIEASKATLLADKALLNPGYQSWALDSSGLAFTAGGYRSAQVNKWLNLFNPATGQVTTVVSKTEAVPGIVAWSPRDDLIAYAAVQASDASLGQADLNIFENTAILKRRVFLLDPKTGKHWRLNCVEAFQDAPTWSDNGKILYYVQRDGDNMVLMAANPSTGEAQVIQGSRSPAPRGVGYYGQSDWDDLLAYRPDSPRAAATSSTETYTETNQLVTHIAFRSSSCREVGWLNPSYVKHS